MLHSERMTLFTVLTERYQLPKLVHLLHSMRKVQLAPGPADDPSFLKGSAVHTYFPVEQHLTEIRSLRDYLGITPPPSPEPVSERELLLTLPEQIEALTAEVRACRTRSEQLAAEQDRLDRELEVISPMAEADLPVPLDLLGGYESVETVTVKMPADAELPRGGFPFGEIDGFHRRSSVRLLVTPKEHASELRQLLRDSGAEPLELPPELHKGRLPREEALRLTARLAAVTEELTALQAKTASIAEQHRGFLCAAEEALVALLEKNHGSTYCTESRYLLVSRFWVPSGEADNVLAQLRKAFGDSLLVSAEPAADRHAVEDTAPEAAPESAPPTRLRNPRWLRPFEGLIELYGLPDYCELDPTFLVGLSFPLFFGFMLGDAGYGLLMIAVATWMRRRATVTGRGMADLAWCMLLGGASSLAFGLFVFGDAFAIPFQEEHGAVFWWGRLLPFLPHPLIVKTDSSAVATMIILALIAGWLHMSAGCVLGVANALRHSIRHAAARTGQLVVLTGMALMILGQPSFRTDALGATLWGGVLAPIDAAGAASVICWLLAVGAILMTAGDGPAGLIEFFGLFSNVVSFSRLALVGVAKAAVAVAVNGAILPMMIGGNAGRLLLGLLLMTVAHAILAGLGALTASIQSLRLNYYEAFSKFYTGGGRAFAPFGGTRIYTRA